jgi:hypothetical protein
LASLPKSSSNDEMGEIIIPKHEFRPRQAKIKTNNSLISDFKASKDTQSSNTILLKIFKIDPLTATLSHSQDGHKAIGGAVFDMYAILKKDKLIDLTLANFKSFLTKKFSQKKSYQKRKAEKNPKVAEKHLSNEPEEVESKSNYGLEIVSDDENEEHSLGNGRGIDASVSKNSSSDSENKMSNYCGLCKRTFNEKELLPQQDKNCFHLDWDANLVWKKNKSFFNVFL